MYLLVEVEGSTVITGGAGFPGSISHGNLLFGIPACQVPDHGGGAGAGGYLGGSGTGVAGDGVVLMGGVVMLLPLWVLCEHKLLKDCVVLVLGAFMPGQYYISMNCMGGGSWQYVSAQSERRVNSDCVIFLREWYLMYTVLHLAFR